MKHPLFITLLAALLSSCGGSSSSTEPAQPTQHWLPPGGNATAQGSSTTAFLQFAPGLSLAEKAQVARGRELFVAEWEPAISSRPTIDGLGPLFIADACSGCHIDSGRAASLNADGSTDVGILFRIGDAAGNSDAHYGDQLQSAATTGLGEGTVRWQRSADGSLTFTADLNEGALQAGMEISPRLSPQLIGMGLLDLIPEATILSFADENDADKNGISGRPHWVTVNNQTRLGRFGWKAINVSLAHQAAGALNGDMGLTTPIHPNENCSAEQAICATEPSGGTPEVSSAAVSDIETFMVALAVPDRRIRDQAQFDRGAQTFDRIGCQQCHKAPMKTGKSDHFALLSDQTIYPYTDLLLHDMGEALNDGAAEINAQATEWRTPPLWGIGLVEAGEHSHFLHDGRATTIDQAIRWHGGEALTTRETYEALSEAEREDLLAFLRSI